MSLPIQNYGLWWKRDEVFWGWQKKPGSLMGIPKDKVKEQSIDFRNQIGVYILLDGFKPIYIGQALSNDNPIFNRLKQHKSDHLADRWDRFSWFGIKKVKTTGGLSATDLDTQRLFTVTDLIQHMEALLIAVVEPPLNRQGGQWKEATQYIQKPLHEIEPDPASCDQLIKEIFEKVCGTDSKDKKNL